MSALPATLRDAVRPALSFCPRVIFGAPLGPLVRDKLLANRQNISCKILYYIVKFSLFQKLIFLRNLFSMGFKERTSGPSGDGPVLVEAVVHLDAVGRAALRARWWVQAGGVGRRRDAELVPEPREAERHQALVLEQRRALDRRRDLVVQVRPRPLPVVGLRQYKRVLEYLSRYGIR